MVILATRPNPYPAAATLIRGLPDDMRADREHHTLTITAQAKLVGVGADTLMRLDAGSNPTQATAKIRSHKLLAEYPRPTSPERFSAPGVEVLLPVSSPSAVLPMEPDPVLGDAVFSVPEPTG